METFLDFYTGTWIGPLPLNSIVYTTLMIACWIYALRRGGAPEKVGATIWVGSSLASVAVLSDAAFSFRSVETGIVIVDLVTLGALLALALRAERFWPLWIAALHAVSTAGHAVKYLDPEVIRQVYAHILAVWAYPILLLLVIGTRRHQQRLLSFGRDESWSPGRRVF